MGILASIVANAVALFATTVVPGITFRGNLLNLLVAGAVVGLFNAIVKPLAVLVSIPFLILTLGLFYLVLNGLLLWAASALIPGYSIAGLIPAILGALVLGLVNWALGAVFGGKKD